MARKSALKVDFWWIPTCEIGEDQPTAFRMRQMVKRDFDKYRHKNQLGAMIPLLLDAVGETKMEDELREAYTRKEADDGFDTDIYRACISEVRNIYVDGEFKESITDPAEIVTAIAGLEDIEVSDELDGVSCDEQRAGQDPLFKDQQDGRGNEARRDPEHVQPETHRVPVARQPVFEGVLHRRRLRRS